MVKRGNMPKKRSGGILWIIILVLMVSLVVSIYFYYPIDCKDDKDCFINEAQVCSRSKVIDYKEGNQFIYEIKSKQGQDCIFYVKLNKMKEGTDYNLVNLLEGKEMLCKLPLEEFSKNPLADTNDIIDNCSGNLKEALQQLTIERLYSVIVGNIGSINKELQKLVS